MFQGPELPEAVPGPAVGPQRMDLRAGGDVQGAAASLAGVLPPAGAARQGVQDRRKDCRVPGPGAAGAVTWFTMAAARG